MQVYLSLFWAIRNAILDFQSELQAINQRGLNLHDKPQATIVQNDRGPLPVPMTGPAVIDPKQTCAVGGLKVITERQIKDGRFWFEFISFEKVWIYGRNPRLGNRAPREVNTAFFISTKVITKKSISTEICNKPLYQNFGWIRFKQAQPSYLAVISFCTYATVYANID